MQIDTTNNISSLLESLTRLATGTTSSSTGSAQSSSGVDYLLSLGQSSDDSDYADLYSSLIPTSYGDDTSQQVIWRFDLSILEQMQPVLTTALSPEEEEEQQALLQQVFDLINANEYDQARELADGMLTQDPLDASAAHALGTVELAEGNYDAAEQLFLRAHAYNSTVGYDNDAANARLLMEDDETVYQRASAMVASSVRREDGISVLTALVDRSPEYVEAHVALGDALLADDDITNGLMQCHAALLFADGNEAEGIEQCLQTLAESYPTSAFIQQLIGKSQLSQEHYDDALITLEHAVELGDNDAVYSRDLASAHVGVGREKLEAGDLTGALAAFERAAELNPTGTDVNAALAEGYLEQAEKNVQRRAYDAASADYQKVAGALEYSADESLQLRAAHGAYALGRRLENARVASGNEIDGEVTAYQLAYDLNEDSRVYRNQLAEARSALGDQLLAAGETREAAYSYKRAWELDRYNDDYRDDAINAFVAYADERLYNLDYDDAVEAYREAYRIDTSNDETKTKLAAAYNARGLEHKSWERWSQAVADFKEALYLFPDNAEYQSNYNSVSAWDD